MKRREAITKLSIVSGAVMLASSGLLQACNIFSSTRTAISEKDITLLDDIAETIIPATASSAGARAAKVGAFMVSMVNEAYTIKQRNTFIIGLNLFDEQCQQQYKVAFTALNARQKKQYLQRLDTTAKQVDKNNLQQPVHYFTMIKQLVINGYFTSEIGATQALRYEAVPGRYDGCIAFKKDDKPWATN